jgi:hypothetical protein
MGFNKGVYEKRVVTGTVAAGTYAESYELYLRPNASWMEQQFAGKQQFICPSTVPTTGNEGATLNTVTKSGNVLTNGWYKVHAQETGFGAKLMFENVGAAASVLYGLGIRTRTAVAGALGVALNVSASAAVAASGQLMGGEFYLQNSGAYTIVGVYESTALHVKSWLAAACGPIASALWIDDQSTTKATLQHLVDMTCNGTVQLDNLMHIYGGATAPAFFMHFDTVQNGFLTAGATVAGTANVKLKCKFNSTTFYLQGYDS